MMQGRSFRGGPVFVWVLKYLVFNALDGVPVDVLGALGHEEDGAEDQFLHGWIGITWSIKVSFFFEILAPRHWKMRDFPPFKTDLF